MLATLLEPVVEIPHRWIGRVPDGRGHAPVEHRSDVGASLLADRLLAGNITDLAVENRCAPFSNPLDGSEETRSTPVSNPVPEPLLKPINPFFESKKVLSDEREGQTRILIRLARY